MAAASPFDAVLFDLDGTLLDTAPDLAWALNQVRREEGLPELPFETIRPSVSHGSAAMIRTGFGTDETDPRFEPRRRRLLEIYAANLARETRPFPGMAELLEEMERRGIHWGVVTNKPARFTEPLLDALGLLERAAAVVSGDSLPERKPHPAPILHACRAAGAEPNRCLYVGDAERDIRAGSRAGVHTLVALFGYIAPDEDPAAWGADGLAATPADIEAWIFA